MPRPASHHDHPRTKSDNVQLTKPHAAGTTGLEIARALGRARAAVDQPVSTRQLRKRVPH